MARLFRQEGALAGQHALVTSGPTIEPIDPSAMLPTVHPARHAIAAALAARGAKVTLVSGPVDQQPPADVTHIAVETARDMLAACEAALLLTSHCAAAVVDWRVKPGNSQPAGKLKKQEGAVPQLQLVESDILATLSRHSHRPRLVVGFAAEAENLQANAAAKLARKGCDWLVANAVTRADGSSVFNSDSNSALFLAGNKHEHWPEMPKSALAERPADRVEAHFMTRPVIRIMRLPHGQDMPLQPTPKAPPAWIFAQRWMQI